MNNKIKKAAELLEGIKSIAQPISGEVMVVMTCDEWDKIMQAKSLLRSISREAERRVVHRCQICKRQVSIPSERVRNTMYSPSCCGWAMHKIYPQAEEPTPSPEAAKGTCESCGHISAVKEWPVAYRNGANTVKCPKCGLADGDMTITEEPVKPEGHAPDCEFQLDIGGSPCTCGYRTASKPETFLKPAKDKSSLCFGHPERTGEAAAIIAGAVGRSQ